MAGDSSSCSCDSSKGLSDDGKGNCTCDLTKGFMDDGEGGCVCDESGGYVQVSDACHCSPWAGLIATPDGCACPDGYALDRGVCFHARDGTTVDWDWANRAIDVIGYNISFMAAPASFGYDFGEDKQVMQS